MAVSGSAAVVAFCLISFASAAWNDKLYFPHVAMFCGKPNMHLDEETGGWIQDPNGTTSCLRTPADVQSYCQKVYPTLNVVDVSEAEEQTVIHNWCRKGRSHCTGHSHIVLPYRCLVAAVKKLEAPEGCESSRRTRHHVCKQPKQLKAIAKKACGDLILHSHSVAKPCDDNGFRAVDFVCCPSPPSSITTLDFNSSEETDLSAEELDSGPFKSESEEGVEWGRLKEETMQEAEETMDEDASLLGLFDDFDIEEQESSEEESEATQEPVKDLVLEYLETPGDDREHERFVLARQALDDKYRSLKMQLMREWEDAEFEGHMKTDAERNFMREDISRVYIENGSTEEIETSPHIA
uniref:amyloid beta precursor like protein 2-like n=1 Tax=Myxine glutinosa TaxID=7769 RepID=UPI00358FEE08